MFWQKNAKHHHKEEAEPFLNPSLLCSRLIYPSQLKLGLDCSLEVGGNNAIYFNS
jgi:hypothetical protein